MVVIHLLLSVRVLGIITTTVIVIMIVKTEAIRNLRRIIVVLIYMLIQ